MNMHRPQPTRGPLTQCAAPVGIAVLTLLLVACSEDGPSGPETPTPVGVDEFVASLGSWSEFSPPRPKNEEEGTGTVTEEVVESVVYQCTETPVSYTDTPREIVMYEPNASIMWVGNLIQGDSYAGGSGTFEELSIRQRDTLRLSIDLLTGDNYAEVPNPTLTSVQSAIGGLIQAATDAGHRSGSSIAYEQTLSHSAREGALRLGLSAKYMGVNASAKLEVSRSANERTMTAHFVQKMFTISIELPQSPSDMFSDALTPAIWQQQIDAGNIGPDNLPVYIAQITYGRTLTYTLTSSDSAAQLEAAIQASYEGLASVEGYTEAELSSTLSQQNIKVTAIGGEGQNVLSLISSGNLADYFTEDAPLTSARPLSYQLNYLGDNSVAKVSETTEYVRRLCAAQAATEGHFTFLPIQSTAPPVATPYSVRTGDFNGDGRGDLLWSHQSAGVAQVAVGFGEPDGTFDIEGAWSHPASPAEGWGNGFELVVGDIDGDKSDDLVWNRRQGQSVNAIYTAFSNGDGTFTAADRVEHTTTGWGDGWRVQTGDMNNDGFDDLVWTFTNATEHAAYIGLSLGNGSFTFAPRQTSTGNGWTHYTAYIGDVNGDHLEDIVWNIVTDGNRLYVRESTDSGTTVLRGPFHRNGTWDDFSTDVGDFNRDGLMDMVWSGNGTPDIIVQRAFGQNTAAFVFADTQKVAHPDDGVAMLTLVGDFNGDGGDDLVFNRTGVGVNRIHLGLSNQSGEFAFTAAAQNNDAAPPTENWAQFAGGILVLDVDGDGLDDIVWNERSAQNRIYVARSQGAGAGSRMYAGD